MKVFTFTIAVLLAACSSSRLSQPTGVQASQGEFADRIEIGWNAVEGTETYRVYRGLSASGHFEEIGYVEAPYTATFNSIESPSDFPITPGEHYYYKIAAVDSGGKQSELSDAAEGWALMLAVPTGLSASQGDYPDRIDLSWNAAAGAATYLIYRSDSASGDYTAIGWVEAEYTATYNSTDSPADYPITPGQHYFYKVSTRDQDLNESGLSDWAEGWAESSMPSDFVVNLWWHKGSGVPYPGVLMNYTIDIGPALEGTIDFSYYEQGGRTETFSVTAQQWSDLYALMLDHDMFRAEWSESQRPPAGAASEALSLTANGQDYPVPTWPGTADEVDDNNAAKAAVRALVPENLWD
jgi:hypothetical protein